MASDRYALPAPDDQPPVRDPHEVEREMIPRGATKKRMAYWYGGRKRFRRALRAAKQENGIAES